MEQYLTIKEGVSDALLFFRLGDFYEMFFEDAVTASRELELTLTGRGGGAEERIPMCGVPYHAAEGYIARLIEKGYKVAICEQVEDPAAAKGIVKREIVRIVTPGTLMEGKLLHESANNYIASFSVSGASAGFAVCDISTGELYVTAMEAASDRLADELGVYVPSELIGAAPGLELAREAGKLSGRATLMTERPEAPASAAETYFSADQLSGLDESELRAAAMLMAYLAETQKRSLGHMTRIRRYTPNQYLILDPFTRRNLELVETVRDRAKKGSLLWLLDRTATSMGGRLLRRWLEKPLLSRERIEARLEAVETLYNQFIVREDLRGRLKEIYDLERLVGRISYGNANARDLLALKLSLRQVPDLLDACAESGSATLAGVAASADACQDIREWIEEAIADDPPVSVRDGGMIRDGYHEHLDQLKEADRNGKRWIAELERAEREKTGVKSLKIGYNKVFGYYIEVTRANLASLPPGRYERKQTLANAERFITPELMEKEALILEAQDKMLLIEYELFQQLRERVAAQMDRLQSLAACIAEIDVYQSLASVSADQRYTKPELADKGGGLSIREGRHPVVEAMMDARSFVANDTAMDRDDNRIMLITGPNMAGKSTYMRQVAMIVIMAQIGCFVPAAEARIPLVDRIFTRIGAADDLIGGQSTFMVEMMDIRVMTEKATVDSLVIIDELGRGTSTGEGMAIAQAVIEYLHDRVGCKTLVSTHFHELAHLEDSLGRLRNHCMAVKESGQQVTFLRKLVSGAASTSYGIYCAQIAGLPGEVIDRSYALLSSYEARAAGGSPGAREAAAAGDAAQAPESVGQERQTVRYAADAEGIGPASEAGRVAETGEAPQKADTLSRSGSVPDDASSAAVQLSLFPEPAKKARPDKHAPTKEDLLAARIRQADLINMTPLQALNFLHELKQQA